MERLTKIGHKGYAMLKGSVCNYSHVSFDCQVDEGIELLKYALEKLAEYEDLEEKGLLLRLPCKIGTSVYMVAQDCGGDALYCRRGDCEGCPDLYEFVEENKFEAYMCDEIGKTVFLTKAEAEQKLEEMESD